MHIESTLDQPYIQLCEAEDALDSMQMRLDGLVDLQARYRGTSEQNDILVGAMESIMMPASLDGLVVSQEGLVTTIVSVILSVIRIINSIIETIIAMWNNIVDRANKRFRGFQAMVKAELNGLLMEGAMKTLGKTYLTIPEDEVEEYRHARLNSHVTYNFNGESIDLDLFEATAGYIASLGDLKDVTGALKDFIELTNAAVSSNIASYLKSNDASAQNTIVTLLQNSNASRSKKFNATLIGALHLSQGAPGFLHAKLRMVRGGEHYSSIRLCGEYYMACSGKQNDSVMDFRYVHNRDESRPVFKMGLMKRDEVKRLEKGYIQIQTGMEKIAKVLNDEGLKRARREMNTLESDIKKTLRNEPNLGQDFTKAVNDAVRHVGDAVKSVSNVSKFGMYCDGVMGGHMQAFLMAKRLAKKEIGLAN